MLEKRLTFLPCTFLPKRNELSGVGTLVKVAGFSPSLSGGNSGYLAW